MPTLPQYTVQAGFSYTAGLPVWTTLANVLGPIRATRGRNDELGQVQAGTLSLILSNSDGRYSPENPASPYYGSLLPNTPIQLAATWAGTTYPLWTGFIDSFTPVDATVVDSNVQVQATDWFKVANRRLLTTTFPSGQMESDRLAATIGLALNYRVWPTTAIDAGNEYLLPTTLLATPALQHIQDVQTAERGVFFVSAGGVLTYHNRHHRFQYARSLVPQITFGQPSGGAYATGVWPFQRMDYVYDDRYIYNDVAVNATGTTEGVQTIMDTASIYQNGDISLAINSAIMGTGQAAVLATFLLAQYKTAVPRVRSLTVDPTFGKYPPVSAPNDLMSLVLATEISDRVAVQRGAPGALNISRNMFVEGISHDIDIEAQQHTVTLNLSDVTQAGPTPWTLDVSMLDATTTLTY